MVDVTMYLMTHFMTFELLVSCDEALSGLYIDT